MVTTIQYQEIGISSCNKAEVVSFIYSVIREREREREREVIKQLRILMYYFSTLSKRFFHFSLH